MEGASILAIAMENQFKSFHEYTVLTSALPDIESMWIDICHGYSVANPSMVLHHIVCIEHCNNGVHSYFSLVLWLAEAAHQNTQFTRKKCPAAVLHTKMSKHIHVLYYCMLQAVWSLSTGNRNGSRDHCMGINKGSWSGQSPDAQGIAPTW